MRSNAKGLNTTTLHTHSLITVSFGNEFRQPSSKFIKSNFVELILSDLRNQLKSHLGVLPLKPQEWKASTISVYEVELMNQLLEELENTKKILNELKGKISTVKISGNVRKTDV